MNIDLKIPLSETIAGAEKQIEAAQKTIADAKAFQAKLRDGDVRVIANYLHGFMCRMNHIDQCLYGWGEKNEYARDIEQQYEQRAAVLIAEARLLDITPADLLDLVQRITTPV